MQVEALRAKLEAEEQQRLMQRATDDLVVQRAQVISTVAPARTCESR